jgi:hypothetical protein
MAQAKQELARTVLGVGPAASGVVGDRATMDNFPRPVLIRRGADLPLLLIFAGVIGRMLAFGPACWRWPTRC